jgi:hypothetical protein
MASDATAKATARQRQRLKLLLAGGKQHLRDTDEFTLLGKHFTWASLRAALQQMLQPYLDYDAALARARVDVGQRRLNLRKGSATNGPWLVAFGEALRGRFGATHPLMKEFGLGRGSRRKPSAAKQAAAVIARKNTRKERGTTGKRRRRR